MINVIIILLCCLAAIYEAGLGILQVIGLKDSGSVSHVITGSFANPGPYGGLIAVLLAVLVAFVWQKRDTGKRYEKVLAYLAMFSAALCFIVLPASMSRAAWLSFGVAVMVLGFREMRLGERIRSNRGLSAVICVLIVILMTGAFLMKRDSAIGRFHIWHMELRAIAQNPLLGTGRGTVLGTYGNTQAEYFAEKERSETIVRIAGCPEYAFNEYLKVGVEYGLFAMLAVIVAVLSLIIGLLRLRSTAAYGAIALAVFSFFSYPFSLIKDDKPESELWQNARIYSSMGLYEDFIEETEPNFESLSGNYRFLYDYGYALYNLGRYEESIDVLKKGAAISSDPMFHNIIGKNHEALHRYDDARRSYLHSHHMVPCRLYPLVLLMEMEVHYGQKDRALAVGKKILSMHVNPRNGNMSQLRSRAEACLDSLEYSKLTNHEE